MRISGINDISAFISTEKGFINPRRAKPWFYPSASINTISTSFLESIGCDRNNTLRYV